MPTDPRSLAQAYQRWLYEDYAHLWKSQNEATRLVYASEGSRHHLTGFQYWMKYQLTTLPDILGWWKLDHQLGALAPDSSRNALHATIFGASLVDGAIDHAYLFDGLNDYLNAGASPILMPTEEICIECLVRIDGGLNTYRPIVDRGSFDTDKAYILWAHNDNKFWWRSVHNVMASCTADAVFVEGQVYHLLGTSKSGEQILYVDGIAQADQENKVGLLQDSERDFHIGHAVNRAYWMDGFIDNIIAYNRIPDQTTITRHSLRRYPA